MPISPRSRAVLLLSQPRLDGEALRMTRRDLRWIHVTAAPDRAGDLSVANPWDRLSHHLEELCARRYLG